jgi:beta-glucosidase
MRKLKAQNIPVVALFVTGRPLWVNREINASDAFVTAWLPGSEGGGVADMLFADTSGKTVHDFQGRLSFAWPATADAQGAKLFPLGYGLSVKDKRTAMRLSEDSGISDNAESPGRYFDKGLPVSSWSLTVSDGGADSTRITTVPVDAISGRVRVSAVDHLTQEGARRFVSRGGGASVIQLTTQAPVDVSRETNGDVMLLMTAKFDTRPQAQVRALENIWHCAEMFCEGRC